MHNNLTPDNCGASLLACRVVNETFLSLDGFQPMRQSIATNGNPSDLLAFAGNLARIVDRERRAITDARFPIGTKYLSHHKEPRLCEVVDCLTVTNLAGEVVKVRYVTSHVFCGQVVTDSDVGEASIAIGVHRLQNANA